MNISDFIVRYLYKKGAESFFILPGGGNMYLIDSVKRNKLNYLSFNHEQAAAIAAESYTRFDNRIGVAIVTSGPGATNTITGIAGSWLDSLPLFVICGQVKTSDLKKSGVRQNGPQEVPIVDLVKPITKYAVQLNKNSNIEEELDKAYKICTSGRKGPVLIDVPLDIQSKKFIKCKKKKFNFSKKKRNKNLNVVLRKIENSTRPLLFIGHGTRLSGGKDKFLKFINKFRIPCVFTWNSKDILNYDHILNLGSPGVVAKRFSNFAVQNCDLIIFIGSRLNMINSAFNKKKFAKNAFKIFIDIDKNELNYHKLKDSLNFDMDASDFFSNINRKKVSYKKDKFSNWISFCNRQKKKYDQESFTKKIKKNTINHYELVLEFNKIFLEKDIIVTGSSGLGIEIFHTYFKNKLDQRIFLTTGLGSMGYGLPAAIGAAVKTKNNIYLIESDGSFMFNIQELSTIKTYNLPICIFLLNNKGYASIRNTQKNYFKSRFVGTGEEDGMFYPDYKKVANAFRFDYFKIKKLDKLNFAYKKFKNLRNPTIIEVVLNKDEILLPKVSAVFKKNKIYSLPLEDMSPLQSLNELKENLINKIDKISIDARK